MRYFVGLVVVIAACGGGGGDADDGGPDAHGGPDAPDGQRPDAGPGPVCVGAATHALAIDAGAFPAAPDHPNVIVRVPDGFDASAPIDVVVYIHGFNNCITNVLGDDNTECTPGNGVRIATGLASQLDASGMNALLVLPEVAYDQASGDPGALADDGGFRALLGETLAALPAPLGPIAVDDVRHVVVASHSGGYQAVASILTVGGVDIDEVWLFDSLYGYVATFEDWITSDLASFTADKRFATFYTSGGGTLDNNQAMADDAASWVAADPSILVDDRTTATWNDATYHHGLLFKASMLTHDGVPQYYVERMLATSDRLAARTCP